MIVLSVDTYEGLVPDNADSYSVQAYADYKNGMVRLTVFYRPQGGGDKRRVDSLFAMSDIQDVEATEAVSPDFGKGTRALVERGLV